MLVPLWTQIGDLMPAHPSSKAAAHLWRWDHLLSWRTKPAASCPWAAGRAPRHRAGQPGAGRPSVCHAVGRHPVPDARRGCSRAPPHPACLPLRGRGRRRVDRGQRRCGAHVARRLPAQGGWNWHAHHNAASEPMAWIDGLDIPFAYYGESQFFEHGRLHLDPHERATPRHSRSERLWAHPGLRPVAHLEEPRSPRCWPTAGWIRTGP